MRWSAHGVRHGDGDGLDFLQLSIVVRGPGIVWSTLRRVGIISRASIWRLLLLGDIDDPLLHHTSVRVRSAELQGVALKKAPGPY